MRHFGVLLLITVWFGPRPAPLSGQGVAAATLAGHVRDQVTDSAIDGAVVIVQGTLFRTRTGTTGEFRITNVAPGSYNLQVLALGYQPDTIVATDVAAGEIRDLVVRLERAPIGMADVVVTAERAPESSRKSTASVTVLPNDEVIRRNVSTLDRALLYQPGVTFNGGDQIDIRGTSGIAKGVGSRVLLMLDGHPILSGDGAETDFASIPLLDLDRVEVVKGAYSSVYGSSALGGVANIITTPVGARPETVARLYYGVYQTQPGYKYTDATQPFQGVGLQHSRMLCDVGARFYFGREATDGFKENGVDDRWVGRVKLSSQAGSEHPWDVYTIWAQEKVGESLTWKHDSTPYEVPDDQLGNYEIDYKTLIGGTWAPVSTQSVLLRVSPYLNYNSTYNHFKAYPADSTPADSSYHTATRLGADVTVSIQPKGTRPVTIGVDAAHTWVHSVSLLGNPEISDGAVFAQYDLIIHGFIKASAGLRVDAHTASASASEVVASPKFGLVATPVRWLTARASIGHGYRAPSAIEQFVNTFQYGFHVIPNPNLKGEKAWSGEVGLTALPWSWARVDGALFRSNFRDQIAPQLDSLIPPTAQFKNVNEAYVRGLDVGVRTSFLRDFLGASASYLFLDTQQQIPGSPPEPMPYRSRHNLTTTVDMMHGFIGVDVRYRSRVEAVLVYPDDPRSAFTVVDLRLNYKVLGTYVQGKVSNVFNTFYTDVQERLPGAPRSVGVTLYSTF